MESSVIVFLAISAYIIYRFISRRMKAPKGSTSAIESHLLETSHGKINFLFQPAKFHKGREIEPPYIEISTPAKSFRAFSLWARSSVSSSLYKAGFYPKLNIGIADLDDQYVFSASDFDQSLASLQGQRTREAWKALAGFGFTRFEHDGQVLSARFVPFRSSPMPELLPFLGAAAKSLQEWAAILSNGIPETVEGARASYLRWSKLQSGSGITVGGAILTVVGVVAGFFFANKAPLIDYTEFLKYWASLTVVLSISAVIGVRSLALKVLISSRSLWSMLVLPIFGLAALAWLSLIGINAGLDFKPEYKKYSMILETRKSRSKSGYSYSVYINSPKNTSESVKIGVSAYQYELAQSQGSELELSLKPGRLGWEWISGKNVVMRQ